MIATYGTAEFSFDEPGGMDPTGQPIYRYWLTREWDADRASVNFICLNPSTADARLDDPTIRRCMGFARRWGMGRLIVTNLYPYRATNPHALKPSPEAIAHRNASFLRRAVSEATLVIAAWGVHATPDFARGVWRELRDHHPLPTFRCLGVTKSGAPRHPLYLRSDTPLEVWPQ